MWVFLFYNTDVNENRVHIHVGKRVTNNHGRNDGTNLAKIWLEPEISLATAGEFTTAECNEMIEIVSQYKDELLKQWDLFKQGKQVEIIKVTKKK